MSIRPLDNLRELLALRSPHWIPFTLDVGAIPGLTGPIMQQFLDRTGEDDPAEYFDYDFRTFSLTARFGGDDPRSYHSEVAPGTTFDEWGIGHAPSAVDGTIGKTYPPLANAECVRDVEAWPAPVIDRTTDLAPIAQYQRRGYPVFGYAGSIYEWSWWLQGMEKFMMGMILQPPVTEAIVAKVAAYTKQLALASARAGIDVLCFYDDVGMQTGMQISPGMWRRYIKPQWREILDTLRSEAPGVRTFLHSCGNIRDVVADLVDLGFDVLHPIQPECMDFAELHREFGRRITLCATLSSQRIFPFGTPDDVRREVRRLKQACAGNRRCILCPSNLIQPETPWDNILAFAQEARTA